MNVVDDTRIQVGFEGRLSVVSESQVHQDGLQRYLVQAGVSWLTFSGREVEVGCPILVIFAAVMAHFFSTHESMTTVNDRRRRRHHRRRRTASVTTTITTT